MYVEDLYVVVFEFLDVICKGKTVPIKSYV